MTQPAPSRLEAGGAVPTIPLLERIGAAGGRRRHRGNRTPRRLTSSTAYDARRLHRVSNQPMSGCRAEMAWLPDRSRRGDGAVAET